MVPRLNIRFQHWVLGVTAALVLFLTGIFLTTVSEKFNAVAEEDAAARFSLIARQSSDRFDALLHSNARFVTIQAHAETEHFVRGGQMNHHDLVSTFMSALETDDTAYSHYFGLANDGFLQVVGIRGNRHIAAALNAPRDAYFAVRRITDGDDKHRESWRFLSQDRRVLGERETTTQYAPTVRPWYAGAMRRGALAVSEPYVFASTHALGITLSEPLPGKIGVLGSDISLNALGAFLARQPLSPNGAILVLDRNGRVIAFRGEGARFSRLSIAPLTAGNAIDDTYLNALNKPGAATGARVETLGQGAAAAKYIVARHLSEAIGGASFQVVALAPTSDFSAPIDRARRDVLLISLGVLVLLVPLSLVGARQVSRALVTLAADSEKIKQLDFSGEPHRPNTLCYEINTLGDAQAVMQGSIKVRTEALKLAEGKLASLVETGLLLAHERDRTVLLKHILFGGRDIAHCEGATLFLKTDHNTLMFAMRTRNDALPSVEIPLFDADGGGNEHFVVTHVALHNETVVIDDVYSETRFDLSGTKKFSEDSGFRTVSMLTVPLSPPEGEVIGVLQLVNALDPATGAVVPFSPELVGFVEALAAQSAVALENRHLLDAQKEVMESLIKLLASAIDAKSPYTGGHCERVPEMAVMLAEEASKVKEGPLADFAFTTEDQWREFRIGAWLHDCGKITTPEYVVDKATKLETIHNRIHEVRARFEILLRDARINCLEEIAAGRSAAEAEEAFAARVAALREDFAFVAECNVGSEFMAPDRVERIARIASQTWLRHFDDRLGLSHAELDRHTLPAAPLPALEPLLADKPWHVLERTRNGARDPKYGFKATVPEKLYNFGEVYNLSVAHGTLTDEERFKINEHIIQTIVMLDHLPLPDSLKLVPEYAGTHHETLTGSGYPRGLSAKDLSIPSRIMAIADIFEALTASDRPYKKAKTLSEAVKILSFFKKDRHIDPDLFDLLLTSGAYKRYGERFLKPEQIDEVDIANYIG